MLFSQRTLPFLAAALLIVLGLAGCSTEHYKREADQEVYDIIEDKWQDDFGPLSNYMIQDAEADCNDPALANNLPQGNKLSLSQAVALSTAQNRTYQNQKEQLYLEALSLTLQRHAFRPQLFGLLGTGYTLDNEEESIGFDGQVGFNQMLATGADIGASIALDWMRFLTGDPSASLGSVLSATFTQPLLYKNGRRVKLENLTQAERDTLYEIRRFGRYRKEFVISTVTDYYRVLQQLDQVDNAKRNYNNLLKLQEQTEAMADTGRLPRYQEGEARQSTFQAQVGYIRAQQSYKTQLDQFKLYLALPADAEIELDPNELRSLEKVGITEPNFSLDQAVATALAQRLDLVNVADQLADSYRKVEVAADGLGTALNLTGGANVTSEERTNIGNLQFHRGKYTLGLEADLPLDRKQERNAYRTAMISLNRREREYAQKIDQVKLDVRQGYRDLQEAYINYKIQVESLKLAKTREEMQWILLQEGRATTRNYLFAQEDLLQAQNGKTRSLVTYTLAKLTFFRDIGILQVRPDGLWETSASDVAQIE